MALVALPYVLEHLSFLKLYANETNIELQHILKVAQQVFHFYLLDEYLALVQF